MASAKIEIIRALTHHSDGTLTGWTIESQDFKTKNKGGLITAKKVFTATTSVQSFVVLMKLRLDPLSHESSCISYWFETERASIYKGALLSAIKQAKFEMEKLVKES
ncbi:MAG: hypothetical protein IAF58_19435 [Leptolyngbya sp.]|nr:hypothetical protein [Candidatus Melainabacteria bacterium]